MIDRTQFVLATTIVTAAFALACTSVAPSPVPEARRTPAPPAFPAPEPEPGDVEPEPEGMLVTATAYNSVPSQGVGSGKHGAWGDRLEPGTKSIAVSTDLLELGLTRGVKVRIEGMEGHYVVLDRLPKRWTRRIDIHMGKDVRAAREWGKREVRISWEPQPTANAD